MSRRLRFALFLAALAAVGPMPSARVVDAARLDVSIVWVRSDRVVSPKIQPSNAAIPSPQAARGFRAQAAPSLSSVLLRHSLFQRPPPLQN